jgi:hypothetical protein
VPFTHLLLNPSSRSPTHTSLRRLPHNANFINTANAQRTQPLLHAPDTAADAVLQALRRLLRARPLRRVGIAMSGRCILLLLELVGFCNTAGRVHGSAGSRGDLIVERARRVMRIVRRAGAFGFVIYQRRALQKGQTEAVLFRPRQRLGVLVRRRRWRGGLEFTSRRADGAGRSNGAGPEPGRLRVGGLLVGGVRVGGWYGQGGDFGCVGFFEAWRSMLVADTERE